VTQGIVVFGKLLYVREGTLVAQEFDDRTLALSGEPVPLVTHLEADGATHMPFSVSRAGVVLYKAAERGTSRLTSMTRSGTRIRDLDFGTEERYNRMALSRDGGKLTVERPDPAKEVADIWVIDVQRGQAGPLTSGVDTDGSVWSPDGGQILYGRAEAYALYDLYALDVDGGRQQLVVPAGPSTAPTAWLPDRTILYTSQATSGGSVDLWRLSGGGKAPGEKLPTPPNLLHVRASPDGHWLAYVSRISGRAEVFVQAYPEGRRQQITSSGGSDPEWRADGKELYYLAEDGTKLMAHLDPTLDGGVAKPLFSVPKGSTYVPAPDGQTFYVELRQPPASPPVLTLLLNWPGLAPKL
jgi:Tol biopolymer transport system component